MMQSSYKIAKLFSLVKTASPRGRNLWTSIPRVVRGFAIPKTVPLVQARAVSRFFNKDPVKKPAEPAAGATDLDEESDEEAMKPSATVINTSGKFAGETDAADKDEDVPEDRDEMLMEWYTRPNEDREVSESKKLLHVKEGMKGMIGDNMEYAAVEDWDPDAEDLPQRNLKDLMAQEAVDDDAEEATKPVAPVAVEAKKDAGIAATKTDATK